MRFWRSTWDPRKRTPGSVRVRNVAVIRNPRLMFKIHEPTVVCPINTDRPRKRQRKKLPGTRIRLSQQLRARRIFFHILSHAARLYRSRRNRSSPERGISNPWQTLNWLALDVIAAHSQELKRKEIYGTRPGHYIVKYRKFNPRLEDGLNLTKYTKRLKQRGLNIDKFLIKSIFNELNYYNFEIYIFLFIFTFLNFVL